MSKMLEKGLSLFKRYYKKKKNKINKEENKDSIEQWTNIN